jgi:hypothetical protein
VLIYFWQERLERRVTNWVGTRQRVWEESAADLTTFVAECLRLAGARGPKGKRLRFKAHAIESDARSCPEFNPI